IREGTEFVLADPTRRVRERVFDHVNLAAALSKAADTLYDAWHLPFQRLEFSADNRSGTVDAGRRPFTCDRLGETCTVVAGVETAPRNSVTSPDGKRAAFIRDW